MSAFSFLGLGESRTESKVTIDTASESDSSVSSTTPRKMRGMREWCATLTFWYSSRIMCSSFVWKAFRDLCLKNEMGCNCGQIWWISCRMSFMQQLRGCIKVRQQHAARESLISNDRYLLDTVGIVLTPVAQHYEIFVIASKFVAIVWDFGVCKAVSLSGMVVHSRWRKHTCFFP